MGQAAPSPQQFPPQPLGTEGHSSVPAEIPIQNTGVFLRWVFLAVSVFTLGSGSYRTETAGHLVPWLPSYNSSSPLLFHKRIQIALKKPKEAVFFLQHGQRVPAVHLEGTSNHVQAHWGCLLLLCPAWEADRNKATLL